ncbi:MAG: methyltransferase domain-containing protein [Thermomicrobiales bacterium]
MQHRAITPKRNSPRFHGFGQRVDAPELLDERDIDEQLLRRNLLDIRGVNRFFGGTSAILRNVPQIVVHLPVDQTIRILDLATGAADIPLAVSRWATSAGRRVSICASDVSPQILDVAREVAGQDAAIAFSIEDARAVGMPDRSFDVVLTSLSLHHFSRQDAVSVLREMDRLSTAGFIVNDLRRSRFAFLATWVASRIATKNPLTRHDAPLSVRRSFTPAELAGLLHEAGVSNVQVAKQPWFRMVAVQVKPE